MRANRSLALLILPLLAAAPSPVAPHGTYVEARTASVFAGACHYNGERVTEGKSAVLAWRIDGGSFDGVDLAGVRIAAAVASDDNLAVTTASRKSAIVVDADSDSRVAAATAWVKSRVGSELGTVASVTRGPVAIARDGETVTVAASGFASLRVRTMPDRACCSQPELVWYRPLMPIEDRRVGYTERARLDVSTVGPTWDRADENSAFVGTFDR